MKTILLAIGVAVATSACATSAAVEPQPAAVAAENTKPPQLWSDHKVLPVPVAVCAERAFNVLTSLGYSDVVRNGNYSYGNSDENRAAVKCVEDGARSFVYFVVAGPTRERVELLRNQIAHKL